MKNIKLLKLKIKMHPEGHRIILCKQSAKRIPEETIGIVDNLNGTFSVYDCDRWGNIHYEMENITEYEAYSRAVKWLGK